ncbi:MAG: hypothetical protein SFU56_04075 [Capsulimonadales bacterium]|nr:hypothetical protein [Capsulimonadales bacterium]
MMSIRWQTAFVVALLLLGAGCANQDQGTVVKYDPQKSKELDQKKIDEIKNNPKIPEAQKQQILSRMGGSQQGAR